MSIHFGDKNVKEIRYGQKKVKEVWYGDKKVWPSAPPINLDLNNGQPIGRMHDGELWFRVNVKAANEFFMIPINGIGGGSYDWDISVDGSGPVRAKGNERAGAVGLPISVGNHYVKITPHNGVTAGWARCLGNGGRRNYWNDNKNRLTFSLEWLPGYAFMESGTSTGNFFLRSAWESCPTLTSGPNGFSLPQNITSVGDYFLFKTWKDCISLTSMPNGFNLPQNITSVGERFLTLAWNGCTSLTSMPNGFNLPQNITSVGDKFMQSTWSRCISLTSSSPAQPIIFPNISGGSYAWNCFGENCPISPDTPTPGSSVMVRRNS